MAENLSRSAEAIKNVLKARDHHDRTCRYGGKGIEVHIEPSTLEYIGWEEGEVIVGLLVVADEKVPPKRLRVYCDIELHGGGHTEEDEQEVLDAIGLTIETTKV